MKIITSSYLYMLHTNINKIHLQRYSVDEISNDEEDTLPPPTHHWSSGVQN